MRYSVGELKNVRAHINTPYEEHYSFKWTHNDNIITQQMLFSTSNNSTKAVCDNTAL